MINLLNADKIMELMGIDEDFLKSDYCTDCNGDGKADDGTQCQSCEELHEQELRADRMMDSWKEGDA